MNSFVNVQVRVLAAQAQSQLNAMNQKLNAMNATLNKGSKSASMFTKSLNGMALDSFGSRVQWAGRQLEYNFTLPLIAAGASAMKLAMDNEAAFTRITKVYGDAQHDAAFYSKEIASLRVNFEQLSNSYGVNQAEVLQVAAAWAAAGASGVALAKSVDLTMQTMILGEMKATEATEALISIQAQYGFGVADLAKTISTLNMVENQTGISLAGLVQGFQRSAGVARATGVDVRHLAAMLAALVPATGSAAQAGNALKTIFSRLISPTKETTEVLGLMGIKTSEMSWKSATMTDRLIVMAKKFKDLSSSQQGVVSSVAASRWQVNKFEILMRDLLNTHGYYQRALQSTAKDTETFNQKNKELQAVLQSNPRRLQIIWTMLQNAAADIITPMIPLLLWLAQGIQKVVTWFSALPQPVQTSIIALLAFLAILGPLVRIGGAVILMTAELGKVFALLAVPIKAVGVALSFLLKMPVMAFLNAMGFLARGGIVALWFLVTGAGKVMVALSNVMILGAAAAGRAFRAGMLIMQAIATGAWVTLQVIFMRAWVVIQGVMLAGAAAAGRIWRAMLLGLAAIQRVWAAIMAISWTRVFGVITTIIVAGFSGITALFTRFIPVVRAMSGAVVAAMTGPWGIAIGLVVILILAFWDELKKIWRALVKGTINAFNSLPKGVHAAMKAVVDIVAAAAMAVYKFFSYLNPWAHHSPSLVENVTTGMDEIGKQFARVASMAGVFKSAYKDMQRFGSVLTKLQAAANAKEMGDLRKKITGLDPGALASYDRLVAILPKLKNLLATLVPGLDRQKAVVEGLKNKLDQMNDALDKQQTILDALNRTVDKYQDLISAAQAKLDGFADAPIKGMKAMSDAIFENEMQQKRLRLEMMKMEQAVGPLDKLQSKIDAINGQIELLRGDQAELRNAGAGSEILSVYDEQIAKLQEQQGAINDQMGPIKNLQSALDELARKGEMLDLENSLKFDPLKRQIDAAANSMRELPFEQIMAGIAANRAEVDRLTVAYDTAKAAADKQKAIVDLMTVQRDAVQSRYDAESKALQKLQDQYDKYEGQIRDIEQALRDAGSAMDTLTSSKKGMSPGAENFLAAKGGNFPDPGGFAQIGREGGLEDQSKLIDDFTKEMADKTANMFGVFSFLDPIKKAWNTAWNWVKDNIGPVFSDIGKAFSGEFANFKMPEGLQSWADTLKDIGKTVSDFGKLIWDAIGPEVIKLGKEAWAGLQDAFKTIQPEIAKFRDLVGPLGEALMNIWKMMKPGLFIILGIILMVAKALIGALAGAIGPVFKAIGSLVGGLIQTLRGVIEFVIGVFTGDWSRAWQGIKDIFGGLQKSVIDTIGHLISAVWGLIKGFVMGIVDFFVWLYDKLVGHSVIPDMVTDIIAWIASLPGKAWNALVTFVTNMMTLAKNGMDAFRNWAITGWKTIYTWLSGLPAAAMGAIARIVTFLGDKARAAFNAFLSGAKTIWTTVVAWITQKPSEAASKIGGIVKAIADKGRDAISSFLTSFKTGWTTVTTWLGGRAKAIKDAIGDMGRLLVGVGKTIMNSLLDGFKQAWEGLKTWLSDRGAEIKNLKGPIQKDRVLLVDEGKAIIEGLSNGMQGQWGGVEGWLQTVASRIADTVQASDSLNRQMAYQTAPSVANMNRQAPAANGTGSAQTVNFYSPRFEFPNVKNGDDAQEFLDNLESIIRK